MGYRFYAWLGAISRYGLDYTEHRYAFFFLWLYMYDGCMCVCVCLCLFSSTTQIPMGVSTKLPYGSHALYLRPLGFKYFHSSLLITKPGRLMDHSIRNVTS